MSNSNQTNGDGRIILTSGFQKVPIIDEQTLRELGHRQVENFYTRLEKTLIITHPTGTERNSG